MRRGHTDGTITIESFGQNPDKRDQGCTIRRGLAAVVAIALQVIAFNVDPWINAMLKNAAPNVDKIFIAYPPRPWSYSTKAREYLRNPTALESLEIDSLECAVEIVNGDWERDEDTRNCLLKRAREQGYDWMVIQDADEFYTQESWARLRQKMNEASNSELLITPWYNFWKSPEYVVVNRGTGIKTLNEGFAVRAKESNVMFTFSRTTNASYKTVIDEPCYHYGYVMDDQAMIRKINSWAHANEMLSARLWYELKWRRWNPNSIYLHPGSPSHWLRAERFPLHQPAFAADFMPSQGIEPREKGIYWNITEAAWNGLSWAQWKIGSLKKAIRASLVNRKNK
ncbi:hypothetical protein KBZ14_04295 [Synechococcus sp. HJ21-Hayes]|uniref:hypothetical protein n=1 Tax=unclassified Synechococcus TaxID=2626047 RepID=UPI0020CED46D|nr:MULTISPECIES: hypothetical protein [unclassified Synechococcus]MCP9832593.1 hypothetical protein [Synechococcus sp. JJ3a-Johnson]MCP9852090.1 hypothetical protein [Synechococcus sp. HJ21-Hayes]